MINYFRERLHIFYVLVLVALCGCDFLSGQQQDTSDQISQADPGTPLKKLPEKILVEETIDGSEMILIPAGEFEMGISEFTAEQIASGYSINFWDEAPQHVVELPDFYIDKYEVTNEQYIKFLNSPAGEQYAKPRFWNHPNFNHPKQPVVGVTWEEATAYARWAGKRLPTEAEWEKAARWHQIKKESQSYPWGDHFFEDRLNYNFKFGRPTLVGSFESGRSHYGVYDMAGNVSEWVEDFYNPKFYAISLLPGAFGREGVRKRDPRKLSNRTDGIKFNVSGKEDLAGVKHRAHRGGMWNDWRLKELNVRCARRLHAAPDTRTPSIGFRCANTGPPRRPATPG